MKTKPNILLIMCDQLRADALGCYGNKLVKTPNMDRIAEKGICFDRAYSQTPVCMPARHALISGKNAFELGMMSNRRSKEEIQYPLAKQIRDAGYYTCAVGKMHFKPVREHFGFDRMYLSEEIAEHIEDDDYLMFLREQGYGKLIEPHGKRSEAYYVPQVSELPEELHTTAWTGEKTCEVIRKNRNRPFFIFSSFIKPHHPFDPCKPYDTMYLPDCIPDPIRAEHELSSDDRLIEKQNDYKVNGIKNVKNEDIRKMRAFYYGCITQIDRQVGRILDTLEKYELLDNTIIILTADHGEMLGDHYAFGKRCYYEQSARIPYIVSWPKYLPQGERRDHFAILQDIYTTLICVSGGKVPEGVAGKNLQELCVDEKKPLRDKVVAEIGDGIDFKCMLRWANYKYIYHANGGRENLFDLESGFLELHDISDCHRDICEKSREELAEYYKSYAFNAALDNGSLVKYPYEKFKPKGYLDQRPKWPETVLET